MGLEEILHLRFANSMLEPVWSRNYLSSVEITMAEDFGVEDRGHFYDPVGALRDVVVNHLMQLVAAAAMEAPSRGDPTTIKDSQVALFRAVKEADPAELRPRPVRRLPLDRRRRRRLDNGDVRGAPPRDRELALGRRAVLHSDRQAAARDADRAAAGLPASAQARLRDVHDAIQPNQLVVKLDPTTGIQLLVEAHKADEKRAATITLDMEFSEEGGEGATPYEVLLYAALTGDTTRFTRQDGVEETWRIMQPLLDAPPPVHPYPPGSWGPKEADELVAEVTASGTDPGSSQ